MSRMYTLFLLCTVSAVCLSLPFRLVGQLPASVIARISQPFDEEVSHQRQLLDDVIVIMPQIRTRRSQPIIDYTDEFSADPFEVPENAVKQRPKTIVIMRIM
ncbi:unnamed protein product [Haemonchus placei]|uniref:Uncharacterized protein n=1 Tax=Haemonchus placei TaxID=6290 RepID=A0A0N4WFZ7_HAEPC|nr:unnamed protein product [Haemonchus placei]